MKTKQKLIIAAVIVVIITAITLTMFFVGKKKGTESVTGGNKGKLPHETDWGKGLTETQSTNIAIMAGRLHDDMSGISWSHDEQVYADLLNMSDTEIIAVANYFYENYGDGENLAQWLNGEHYGSTISAMVRLILDKLYRAGIVG